MGREREIRGCLRGQKNTRHKANTFRGIFVCLSVHRPRFRYSDPFMGFALRPKSCRDHLQDFIERINCITQTSIRFLEIPLENFTKYSCKFVHRRMVHTYFTDGYFRYGADTLLALMFIYGTRRGDITKLVTLNRIDGLLPWHFFEYYIQQTNHRRTNFLSTSPVIQTQASILLIPKVTKHRPVSHTFRPQKLFP
jgi:hypothetical protein